MKEFSVSRSIDASPDAVWGVLTDASQLTDCVPDITRIEGNIASGQKVTVHTTLSSRAFPVTVSTFEPSRRMVWTGGMPLGLFKGERTFTLMPQGDGTEFSMREQFTGLLSPLIGRTIPDLNPSFANFADGVKARAEGGE